MANSISYSSIVQVLEPLKRPPVYHTHLQSRLHLSGHSLSFIIYIEACVNGLRRIPSNEVLLEARRGNLELSSLALAPFQADGHVAESL